MTHTPWRLSPDLAILAGAVVSRDHLRVTFAGPKRNNFSPVPETGRRSKTRPPLRSQAERSCAGDGRSHSATNGSRPARQESSALHPHIFLGSFTILENTGLLFIRLSLSRLASLYSSEKIPVERTRHVVHIKIPRACAG